MKYFEPSELIINEDGSIFHLHIRPEQLAHKVVLVGDPGRVSLVASYIVDSFEIILITCCPSVISSWSCNHCFQILKHSFAKQIYCSV